MRAPTSLALLLPAVLLAAPAMGQEDDYVRLDGKFERIEQVGQYRILLLEGGGSYRMTDRTFEAHERLWFFLKKGDKVHLTTKRGWALRIEKGWKTEASLQTALIAKLQRASEGDRVLINGQPYLFLAFTGDQVKVSPKLPGGDFGYSGEEMVSLSTIETFEPAPQEEGQVKVDLATDTLQIFKVEAGDTVKLTLGGGASLTGVVAALSPTTCELLEWRGGAFGERRRVPRPQVQQVTHEWLDSRHRVRLENGELVAELSRYRRAATGPLELKLSVVHDMPDVLVRDLAVQLHLRTTVGGGGAAAGIETVSVPPLLPRRPHRVAHEVTLVTALDLDVQLTGYRALGFEHPDVREPLLQAISRGAGLPETAALYRGAGRAKDARLVRLLLTRALYPPARSGETAEDHAAAARAGLVEAGDVALDVVFEDLEAKDEALGLTTLDEGALAREPLPETTPPLKHRRALVGLLPQLPGGVEGARGRILFAFHSKYTDLAPAIEQAFAARPDVAAPLLLELAVPAKRGVAKAQTDAASAVLRAIGRPAIEPLVEALQAAGADLTPLGEVRQRYGKEQPFRVIEAALEVARAKRAEDWRRQLGGRLEEAKALGKEGRLPEAIELAREALRLDPEVPDGTRVLADLLHDLAVDREAEQLTGEAALLLEEAVRHRPASRASLARLMLAGVRQDLGAVVVRAQPHVGAPKIGGLLAGKRLPGKALSAEWVEVESDLGTGYVHATCLDQAGGAFVVNAPRTPLVPIERAVGRIKELDATLRREADKVLGTYYALEAERLYEAANHDEAIDMFERAAALVPDDPRLGLATRNWIQANLGILGLLAIVLAGGGVGIGVLVQRHRAETRARAEAAALQSGKDTGALRIDLFESDMGVTIEEEHQGEGDAPPPA